MHQYEHNTSHTLLPSKKEIVNAFNNAIISQQKTYSLLDWIHPVYENVFNKLSLKYYPYLVYTVMKNKYLCYLSNDGKEVG